MSDDAPRESASGSVAPEESAIEESTEDSATEESPIAETATRPYVESPIIMATVRVVAPFVFTFGLFIMFHGADSSGGGFQGGVIVGTVVLMLGIAFGIGPTREWVDPSTIVVLVGLGTLGFVSVGLGTVALDGAFLDYPVFGTALGVPHPSKYGIELVELLIGVIVAGIITGLFFAIAAGTQGGESA